MKAVLRFPRTERRRRSPDEFVRFAGVFLHETKVARAGIRRGAVRTREMSARRRGRRDAMWCGCRQRRGAVRVRVRGRRGAVGVAITVPTQKVRGWAQGANVSRETFARSDKAKRRETGRSESRNKTDPNTTRRNETN